MKKWTTSKINEQLFTRHIQCVDDLEQIARPSTTKVRWECERGHSWKATVDSVRRGSGCPVCAGNQKHTLDTVQPILDNRNDNIKVVELYNGTINAERKGLFVCCNCNNRFTNTLSNVLGKHQGCSYCNRAVGALGRRWFSRTTNLRMRSWLYLVEFKNDDECFVKVGITKQPLTSRFGLKRYKQYNIDVLFTKQGTIKSVWEWEIQTLRTYAAFHYTPKLLRFCGRTECFLYDQKESILEYVRELTK